MNQSSSDICIEIRDLSFRYPLSDRPVLESINLEIHRGEFVVVTGPTGCGKTTLALCLNSLIPNLIEGEMSGEVRIHSMLTAEHPVHEFTPFVGLVFQNPEDQLFSLRVVDEVAFGVENMGYSRTEIVERVDRAIRKVNLWERRDASIFKLSGGQKQKVAIASNLAVAPEILVLDAPTADLDPVSSSDVIETLDQLRRQDPDRTVIVVDSDISKVVHLATRLIVLKDGGIYLDGSPSDLLSYHLAELIDLGIRIPEHLRPAGFTRLSPTPVRPVSDPKPVVSLKDVSFRFPNGPTILDHTSFAVAEREFVAIIGENGTGKSTLLKMVSGLLKPQAGVIETGGMLTSSARLDEVLRNVGYLFQNPDHQLFMPTVEAEIRFSPERQNCSHEEVERRVAEALRLTVLEAYRDKHPFTLSRGQRQRLAVATVLAAHPRLILLDEPTTGQDQIALDNLMELVQNLIARQNTTVMMVTHDMDLVARYASRVIVLSQGRILWDGSPLDLFERHPEVLSQASLKAPELVRMAYPVDLAATNVSTFG